MKMPPITRPEKRANIGIKTAWPVPLRRGFLEGEGRISSSKKICTAFFNFGTGLLSKEAPPLECDGDFLGFSWRL